MVETDIGRVGKPKHALSHPTVPWEGMDGLGYTLSLLFIHPTVPWEGINGLGYTLSLLFIHPTVPWEGMCLSLEL